LVRPQQWKRDISFCTWNVRSLYRLVSLAAASKELARYKLNLVGAGQVRLDKGDTVRVCDFFFYGKGNGYYLLGTGFFVHHRIASAVNRVKFVIDRCSYIVLRGRWYHCTECECNK